MSQPQVIIVGAGVTGSLLASFAKEMGLSVRVLEKSRGAGGRMATHTFRAGDRNSPVLARADLGAQYITTRASPDHPELGPIYRSLLDAQIIAPFHGEIAGPNPYGSASAADARPSAAGGGGDLQNYSAKGGLASVSKHFLETAAVSVEWGKSLDEVQVDEDGRLQLRLEGDEAASPAGDAGRCCIVLTQPVPQVLGNSKFPVSGNFLARTDPAVLASLGKVSYSSRYAAAFLFSDPAFQWPYGWTVSYFSKGDVRYASRDTSKRGATEEPATSVLVHGGVPMGIELIDEEAPFATASARLRADLDEKMPEVPWSSAAAVKMHKWRYSQVYKGYGGTSMKPDWVYGADDSAAPGAVELWRQSRSLGLLLGDALAPASNFEGCIFSAHKGAKLLRDFFAESRADL